MYDPEEMESENRKLFKKMEMTGICAEKQFCKFFGQFHGENIAYCVAHRFIEEQCPRAECVLESLGLSDVDCWAIIGVFDGYLKALDIEHMSSFNIDDIL